MDLNKTLFIRDRVKYLIHCKMDRHDVGTWCERTGVVSAVWQFLTEQGASFINSWSAASSPAPVPLTPRKGSMPNPKWICVLCKYPNPPTLFSVCCWPPQLNGLHKVVIKLKKKLRRHTGLLSQGSVTDDDSVMMHAKACRSRCSSLNLCFSSFIKQGRTLVTI